MNNEPDYQSLVLDMSTVMEAAVEVVNAITSAFNGVSREGGVSLHETRVLDGLGSESEMIEARAKDIDAKWQDVPDSAIEKPLLSLNFLDPIGFRYYIPAYMIWEIRIISGEKWVDCNTHGAAAFALTPRGREPAIEAANFVALTKEQSHAIYLFLRFCADFDDEFARKRAQAAIDKYWIRFA
jgi:hypothetical protein